MKEFSINTPSRNCTVDINSEVAKAVSESGVTGGLAFVYVPHTTAAVTVNEGADPDVRRDIIVTLEKLIPHKGDYRHMEGNSDAHIKSTIVGVSEAIPVSGGKMVLGTWQKIFFCEFDGPRRRRFYVSVIPE